MDSCRRVDYQGISPRQTLVVYLGAIQTESAVKLRVLQLPFFPVLTCLTNRETAIEVFKRDCAFCRSPEEAESQKKADLASENRRH
jgi:hypothetical protein